MGGDASSDVPLPPRVAEARALAAAAALPATRVLCTTLGRGQAALALARQHAAARVCCWLLDDFQARLAVAHAANAAANLTFDCQADPPPDAIDLAVIPLAMRGEAELARDVLQAACQRLVVGGRLVAAVDHPHDRWLHDQLGEWFGKISVQPHNDAVVYIARKTHEPRRWRDFRCEFAFRDEGRLLRAVSRPGVFAHRRVDAGARQLLAAAVVAPGERVLDVGCGAGIVGIALAARDATVAVHAVDSNARAAECTLAGAALNGLANLTAEVNSTGSYGEAERFDLAVANPPYYANFAVARLFVAAAQRSLRPGGRLLIVTKQPDWYLETLPTQWDGVRAWASKDYAIVAANRR